MTSGHPPAARPTTVAVTPLCVALGVIAIGGLLIGVLTHQRDAVVLAAPAAALLAYGLSRAPGQHVALHVDVALSGTRVLVGDVLHVHVHVVGPIGLGRLAVALRVGAPLAPVSGGSSNAQVHRANVRCTYEFEFASDVIGSAGLGPVALRWHDPIGLVRYERVVGEAQTVRVVPDAAVLRSLVSAAQTGSHVGEQMSRGRADGFELADIRPWRSGDSGARINWRISARRDGPWVVDRHPDRNEDVVVFVDSFADARGSDGRSSLASCLQIAAAIASAHVARRDRVGFIGYGGVLRWIVPAAGQLARYRLIDTMVETVVFASQATKDVSTVPVRALPNRALVVVVTPLLDPRGTAAIRGLIARGHDLVVIAVDPLSIVDALPAGASETATMGRRLWALDQANERRLLAATGVPVVRWARPVDGAAGDLGNLGDLDSVLRELTAWRQRMRTTRAAGVLVGR